MKNFTDDDVSDVIARALSGYRAHMSSGGMADEIHSVVVREILSAYGAAAAQDAQVKLERSIRHLYSSAVNAAANAGMQTHDAPRLLVAAAAHGITFLIERIGSVQVALEGIKDSTAAGVDDTRANLTAQLDKMATDLSRTMQEFELALHEGMQSLRQMRDAEDEPPADDDKPGPKLVTH